MKSLPQIVDDMRTNAAFLMELAGQIEEVANFFGGGVISQPAQPKPSPIEAVPAVQKEKRPYTRRTPLAQASRVLSAQDKSAILSDWESLPKHRRTGEYRTALSLKHQCSPMQVAGIANQVMLGEARKAAALARRQSVATLAS